MASITSSTSSSAGGSYNPRMICQIVGYACLAGFVVDMLVLTLPPSISNPQWRVGTLQQISDRSVILLFSAALLIFSINSRRWLKQFSRLCLLIGAIFVLACPLAITDTAKLQQQAINNITTQANQYKTQLDTAKANPKAAGPNITAADLDRASQKIDEQSNTLTQNARTTSIKAGTAITGNLIVMGLAFIFLGRYGMQARTR
jgi:hypothetical protein